ncbi:MAG: lipase [Oscillospiraceae bacterium]|nr:lipase [Oscillospiraceae bacterium]
MMKRVLCIGDSNTYGFDPRSYIGSRYPETVRWTCLLQKDGREIINCGQNGLCIPREYQYAINCDAIRSYLPLDLIIVMLGSNDLLEEEPVDEIALNLERFLRVLQESFPDTKILLISPPVMKRGSWVPSQELIDASRKLGKTYKAVAEHLGIFHADAEEWKVELTYDGVHFTENGHAAFAKGLNEVLSSIGY